MRYVLLLVTVTAALLSANESVIRFFNESKANRIMCRETEYTYILLSQKNAEPVELKGHTFFKLKGKNRYISITGCQPLTDEKEAIIF